MRAAVLLVGVALLAGACGEPEPDIDVPSRDGDQAVADLAGVLDAEAVGDAFGALAEEGWDAVALTFETDQANQGEAQRGGRELLEAWQADIVVVAVAVPGDFDSEDEGRTRAVGVEAPSARAVPGDLREEVASDVMGPRAADNEWTEAFLEAAEALEEGLDEGGP